MLKFYVEIIYQNCGTGDIERLHRDITLSVPELEKLLTDSLPISGGGENRKVVSVQILDEEGGSPDA